MIPKHLIPQLGSVADSAINRILKGGAPGHSKPSGEVGFVAAVVLGGVPAIASAWAPILSSAGYSVAITGVFCHQAPQVSFNDVSGAPCHCELADLLLVAEDRTGTAPGKRWGALIQAKMAKPAGGQSLTKRGDLVQLDLMTRWPPFSMPAGYANHPRDLSTCTHPGALLDCGQYGLIVPQPYPSWHQQLPAIVMPAGGDQLGTFLAHMIERGQVGFGREATGIADDWSSTVDELLKVTARNPFSHKPSFTGTKGRGKTSVAFTVDKSFAMPPGGKNSNGDSNRSRGEDQGISALVIEVFKNPE